MSVSCGDDSCSDRLEAMAMRCCTGYGGVVAVVLVSVVVVVVGGDLRLTHFLHLRAKSL